jgi:drug/metabolite transporter (DMT)-like permease
MLIDYFNNRKNTKSTWYAIGAVVIGTMIADIFLWLAIGATPKPLLALTVAIIHTVPIFSLLLLWLVFKEAMSWKAIAGIFITVLGCIITIYYGNLGDKLG